MIASFIEIAKSIRKNRKQFGFTKDEEGRVTRCVTVRDDSDFLSPYSLGEHKVISPDVAEFLENTFEPVPVGERLHIDVHSDEISEQEQEDYRQALKNYYSDKYESSLFQQVRMRWIAAIMFTIGVLALISMIMVKLFSENEIVSEVVDIFAWVFIWEGIDVFFLEGPILRRKQKRYLAFIDAKLEFHPLNKEKTE